jgi:hypothetical protein
MKALRSSPMTAMQVVETAIIFGLHVVVLEAVDHVVEAAEHRRVLNHRRGHRSRLMKCRQMAAIITTSLRAVHEGIVC